MEIDRFIIGRVMLPTPKDDTDPFARECPDGGLRGGALVALLLGVGMGPEGMPNRFSGPRHERVSQECGALKTPMDPGFVSTSFRHRCNASILLELIGRGVAVALFPEGDEETRGKDRAGSWSGSQSGEVGMALSAVRNGVVEGRDRVQDHAELGDEGLDQEGSGDDDTLIRGQRCGALDGVEALIDDVGVASVMSMEKTLQGGAACELCCLEGWPLGENIAEDGGVFVVKPLQDMRTIVFQGTGETIRGAHVVAHEASTMFDAWFAGTHRGALGLQGRELSAMLEQEFELELGISGVVLGVAGCEGFTVPGERERIDGKEHEAVVLSQRVDNGPLVEFATDGDRLSLAPRAPGTHPRIESFWRVRKDAEPSCLGASRLQADIVCGISPIEADECRKFICR